jgi:hypothetical protein
VEAQMQRVMAEKTSAFFMGSFGVVKAKNKNPALRYES